MKLKYLLNHMLSKYIEHCRNRKYMSGVERDKLRIKQTAEIFTPTPLVQEILDKLEQQDPTLFSDSTKTFLDNSCGDCQFLSEVVIKKMEKSGCSLEDALSTTQLLRSRLLQKQPMVLNSWKTMLLNVRKDWQVPNQQMRYGKSLIKILFIMMP